MKLWQDDLINIGTIYYSGFICWYWDNFDDGERPVVDSIELHCLSGGTVELQYEWLGSEDQQMARGIVMDYLLEEV